MTHVMLSVSLELLMIGESRDAGAPDLLSRYMQLCPVILSISSTVYDGRVSVGRGMRTTTDCYTDGIHQ